MSDKRLLTVSEASEILHVSMPTAWRMIRDGRLPVIRLGPKTVRIDPHTITALCAIEAR